MTLYAGETLRVSSTVTDFNGVPLDDTSVTTATIEIWDAVDDVVLDELNMAWDADSAYWFYDWQTLIGATPSPIDAGTYQVRIRFTGVNFTCWEYQKIKLKANPLPL